MTSTIVCEVCRQEASEDLVLQDADPTSRSWVLRHFCSYEHLSKWAAERAKENAKIAEALA